MRAMIIFVLVLMALVVGLHSLEEPGNISMTLDEQNESMMRAVEVAAAVERYAEAEGHYPESLSEIQPRFLEAEIKDATGRPFRYYLSDEWPWLPDAGSGFRITFDIAPEVVCAYASSASGWKWECSGEAE